MEDALEKWFKRYGKVIDKLFFYKGLEMGFIMGLIFVGLLTLVQPLIEAVGRVASGIVMVSVGVAYMVFKRLLLGRNRYRGSYSGSSGHSD